MKITLLGTGTSSGVPMIGCKCKVCHSNNPKDKRLRTSALVEVDDKVFAIDCGPDFRQQMLREQVDRLDAVLFTHEHKDHTGGLDDIRAYNFLQKKKIPIYGSLQVLSELSDQYGYIFVEKPYPGIPQVDVNEIALEPFEVEGVKILPIQVLHHKLKVTAFRIGDFTYVTDASFIDKTELAKIKGTKLLVVNSLRHKEHLSHFTLDEALALVMELKPERTYLTHISHQLGLHEEVETKLPPNVWLGYDGLKLYL